MLAFHGQPGSLVTMIYLLDGHSLDRGCNPVVSVSPYGCDCDLNLNDNDW
jgi:hypothetical protein